MSRSGNAYIAATQGTQFTLYAVMRSMGLHITPDQAEFQAYLEANYPPVVESTREPNMSEDDPKEDR